MWFTSLLKSKLPFIKNETGTTEKYTKVAYVIIGNPAFSLALYLTEVHFRGELQHVGIVSEQKIKWQPNRTRRICGIRLSDELYGLNKWRYRKTNAGSTKLDHEKYYQSRDKQYPELKVKQPVSCNSAQSYC